MVVSAPVTPMVVPAVLQAPAALDNQRLLKTSARLSSLLSDAHADARPAVLLDALLPFAYASAVSAEERALLDVSIQRLKDLEHTPPSHTAVAGLTSIRGDIQRQRADAAVRAWKVVVDLLEISHQRAGDALAAAVELSSKQ